MFFFLNRSEFRQKLIGYVISELRRQNVYSAGKTSGVLRGDASGANMCYVLPTVGGRVFQNTSKELGLGNSN